MENETRKPQFWGHAVPLSRLLFVSTSYQL